MSLPWIAGVLELLGGAFAYQSRFPVLNGGDIFLYTAVAGPGAWSLDAALDRGHSTVDAEDL